MNIVCFAAERLDPVWRRRKHLMTRFEAAGHRTLFVEAPLAAAAALRAPARFPAELRDRRRTVDGLEGFRPIWPFPFTRRPGLLRLNLLSAIQQVNAVARGLGMAPWVAWVSQPFWALVADRFRHGLVYDCTDDWSLMPGGGERFRAWDRDLARAADVVNAVSRSLYDAAAGAGASVNLIPNGVDFDHYQGEHEPPEALKALPRPWFGYIGSIWAERMDMELVAGLARELDGGLALIGPVNPDTDLGALARRPNVLLAGARPYAELPAWVSNLDVCLIPHRVNALTRSMDPIKVYEYLAAGRPVVTTPVAGVEAFGDLVRIASGLDDFVRACRESLADDRDPERRARAREHSWDARFQQVLAAMTEAGLA